MWRAEGRSRAFSFLPGRTRTHTYAHIHSRACVHTQGHRHQPGWLSRAPTPRSSAIRTETAPSTHVLGAGSRQPRTQHLPEGPIQVGAGTLCPSHVLSSILRGTEVCGRGRRGCWMEGCRQGSSLSGRFCEERQVWRQRGEADRQKAGRDQERPDNKRPDNRGLQRHGPEKDVGDTTGKTPF